MSKPQPLSTLRWTGAATLGLALAACGLGDATGPTASGLALTGAAVPGTVTLNDASRPTQTRTATTSPDGTFAIQVAGLLPPYLLRVEWDDPAGVRRLYAVAAGNDVVDVNGLSDLAYGGASLGEVEADLFAASDAGRKQELARKARTVLAGLGATLSPLFERYGVADPQADRDAVRLLLADVGFARAGGVVSVTNRATSGLIFEGPLSDLGAGTLHPAAMPAGPPCLAFTYADYGPCQPTGTRSRSVLTATPVGCSGGAPDTSQACLYVPPHSSCVTVTYSDFGACLPDGTQSRSVLASTPAGCTRDSLVTSQGCRYVPPLDGAALYALYCSGCHGDGKKARTAAAIQRAIDKDRGGMGTLGFLSAAQVAAISAAR